MLDAGPLIAYYNRQDAWHEAVRRLLDEEELLVLPMPVIPEVDYVLESRLGSGARLAFEDPVGQVYQTVGLPESGYARVPELNGRYPELGFVDAAVIAIAEELRISPSPPWTGDTWEGSRPGSPGALAEALAQALLPF